MNPIAAAALQSARARLTVEPQKKRTRRIWTDAEAARLAELYPDTPMPDLIKAFGRAEYAIYGKAYAMGLSRSDEYLASEHACRLRRDDNPGLAYRFKQGATPWNKGTGFNPGGRSIETRFAPGSVPHNNVPVGTERVTDDGIRQRKVRDDGPAHRRWKSVHSILWEETHGAIPKGHLVVFRDKNPKNIVLPNLELITRGENMRRNTIHRYPDELKDTIRQLGRLKKAIREASDEKQDD